MVSALRPQGTPRPVRPRFVAPAAKLSRSTPRPRSRQQSAARWAVRRRPQRSADDRSGHARRGSPGYEADRGIAATAPQPPEQSSVPRHFLLSWQEHVFKDLAAVRSERLALNGNGRESSTRLAQRPAPTLQGALIEPKPRHSAQLDLLQQRKLRGMKRGQDGEVEPRAAAQFRCRGIGPGVEHLPIGRRRRQVRCPHTRRRACAAAFRAARPCWSEGR